MSPEVRNQGTLLPTPLTSEAEKVIVTFNVSINAQMRKLETQELRWSRRLPALAPVGFDLS